MCSLQEEGILEVDDSCRRLVVVRTILLARFYSTGRHRLKVLLGLLDPIPTTREPALPQIPNEA